MQLSRVVNHTLFKAIIGMKLPTFYQQIANTLPTDHRQSTNSWSTVGQQMSCRKLSFQKNLNKSVGQLSVRCWSTVGQLSADRSPTVGWQSADRLPTVGRQITNSRPTDNQQSANCRWGELFFTITEVWSVLCVFECLKQYHFVCLQWKHRNWIHSIPNSSH